MSRKGFRRLMTLAAALAVFIAVFIAATYIRGAARDRRLLESRDKGIRLATAGEYEAGLISLSPYVARVKDDYEALLAYANCRVRVSEPNNNHVIGAISAAKLATDVSPGRPEAFEFLVTVYSQIARQTELLDACDKLLTIEPTNEFAMSQRIDALITLDLLDRALAESDAYIEALPDRLGAYATKAEVLSALGVTPAEIDEYLRSDDVAARLGHQPEYMLRLIQSAWSAGRATGDPDGTYMRHSLDSARKAAAMTPDSSRVAAGITSSLRRLGLITGDESLIRLAEATTDRYIEAPGLGADYAAIESRAAWWRFDDAHAIDYAERIAVNSEDTFAVGWRLLIAEIAEDGSISCDGCADALASIGTREAEYWNTMADAFAGIASGADAKQILALLERAGMAAPVLDARTRTNEFAQLVALAHARVYLRIAQLDSARSVLELAGNEAKDGPFLPRLRLMLAEVYTQQGEIARASELLVELHREGIDDSKLAGVHSRYTDRRLVSPRFDDTPAAARRQLDSVGALVDADPANASLALTHARLLLTAGETDRGLEAVDRALTLGAPDGVDVLIRVAELVDPIDPVRSTALLDLATVDAQASVRMITARALLVARRGDPEAGLALFEHTASAGEHARADLDIARAVYMENVGLGGVMDAFRALSDEHPESARAQTAVIESREAWGDEPLIRGAISRLRASTSEASIEWQIASHRADLAFIDSMPEQDRGTQLSKTILGLTRISERVPQNTAVLRLIALAYDMTGQPGDAIRTLRRSVTRSPDAYPDLVKLLMREGRHREANDELGQFLAVPRTDLTSDMIRLRADLLEINGRVSESLPDRGALAESGRASDLAALGYALARSGDAAEAQAVARQLASDTQSLDAVRSAARIMLEAGRPDLASEVFLASSEGRPTAEAHTDLARLFADYSYWAHAESHLRTAIGSGATDEARVMLAHVLLEQGNAAAARDALSGAVGGDAQALVAMLDLATGQSAEAGGTGNGTPLVLARVLAAAFVSEREIDALLAAAITEHQSSGMQGSDLGSALGALASHPESVSSQLLWTARVALARDTNSEDLTAVLEEAADALGVAWPLRELALTHLYNGRLVAAENAANRLSLLPDAEGMITDAIRARIAAARGLASDALGRLLPYRDRLAAGEADETTSALFAAALAATGRASEAESFIGIRLEADPASVWFYLDAASELPLRENDTRRAWLDALDAAVGSTDRLLDRGRARAALAWMSGEPADAERALELLNGVPGADDDLRLALFLASLEQRAGRPEQAAQRYRALLGVYPENAQVLNDYADLLTTRFDRAAEALPMIERAIALSRGTESGAGMSGTLQHTLGVVYRSLGRTGEAERALGEGIELAGPVPGLVIELAEILVESGRNQEAGELLARLQDPRTLPRALSERAALLRKATP